VLVADHSRATPQVYFRTGLNFPDHRVNGTRQQARATLMRPVRLAVMAPVSEQGFATK
jgi:hypothetical protein